MTRPRILLDPSLAGYFEPGLHEPMAERPTPRPTSPYRPPRTITEAEHRVVVALRQSRKAAGELLARPLPDNPRQDWSKELLGRVEGAHDLLDRAVADLERLEEEQT